MALAKLTAETAMNTMTDVPPNKLQEQWKELCLGDSLNKYRILPPVRTGNKTSGKSIPKHGKSQIKILIVILIKKFSSDKKKAKRELATEDFC